MNWIGYIIVMSLPIGLIVALILLDLYGGTKWVEPDPLDNFVFTSGDKVLPMQWPHSGGKPPTYELRDNERMI